MLAKWRIQWHAWHAICINWQVASHFVNMGTLLLETYPSGIRTGNIGQVACELPFPSLVFSRVRTSAIAGITPESVAFRTDRRIRSWNTRYRILITALVITAPLAATAQEAVGKRARTPRNRRPYVAIDIVKMFTAGPLSNPQPPSTLLPAGATAVELTVHADKPTLCRYSVGRAQPLEQMIPFDARKPSSSPKTTIRGLDPNPSKVNDVYVRCAAAPEAVLHLQYRSLPAAKPGFPRTANLWGSWRFIPKGMEYASRFDLWLGAHFNADQIRQLRRLNPNCFILTSINTVENNDVPDEYFLRDTTGKRSKFGPARTGLT